MDRDIRDMFGGARAPKSAPAADMQEPSPVEPFVPEGAAAGPEHHMSRREWDHDRYIRAESARAQPRPVPPSHVYSKHGTDVGRRGDDTDAGRRGDDTDVGRRGDDTDAGRRGDGGMPPPSSSGHPPPPPPPLPPQRSHPRRDAWRRDGRFMVPAPFSAIEGITFDAMSDAEVKARSMAALYKKAPTASKSAGTPANTVIDPRGGPADSTRTRCGVCNASFSCPGHPMHIQLAFRIYNTCFLRSIARVLPCVCFFCSDMVDGDGARMYELDRTCPPDTAQNRARRQHLVLERLSKTRKQLRTCARCRMPQPRYTLHRAAMSISTEWTPASMQYLEELWAELGVGADPLVYAEIQAPFHAGRAHDILSRVSPDTLRALGIGLDSLSSWCPSVLNVLPPPFRPSALVRTSTRSDQHDITLAYDMIAQHNEQLFQATDRARALRGIVDPEAEEAARVRVGAAERKQRIQRGEQLDAAMDTGRTCFDNEEMDRMLAHAPRVKLYRTIQTLFHTYTENNGAVGTVERSHSGKPMHSIRDQLVSKNGDIRAVMEAKRCNHTQRGTIGGAAWIHPCQVGMPLRMCNTATTAERVTTWNRRALQEAVLRGPGVYGGAAGIHTAEGMYVPLAVHCPTLEDRKKMPSLRVGWVVDRHLVKGEITDLNRPPSIKKHSIMAHEVVPVEGDTLRMALETTVPYNADFDGDDMTGITPQDERARTEALLLMSVTANLLDPSRNAPALTPVQDTVTGMATMHAGALLSLDTFAKLEDAVRDSVTGPAAPEPDVTHPRGEKPAHLDLPSRERPAVLVAVTRPDGSRAVRHVYTGLQALSLALRAVDVYCVREREAHLWGGSWSRSLANHGVTYVRGGRVLSGVVDKGTMGGNLGIVHTTALLHGCGEAMSLMCRVRHVVSRHMTDSGFSVRIEDSQAPPRLRGAVMSEMRRDAEDIRALTETGRALGMSEAEMEPTVCRLINASSDAVTRRVVADAVRRGTSVMHMVRSGAKGSDASQKQPTSVGQFRVGGARLLPKAARRARLSCFAPGDTSIEAAGFSYSGYQGALRPAEAYDAATSAREGISNKTVATADSGVFARTTTKSLEDVVGRAHAAFSTTTRVQRVYGGDGYDASRLVKISVKEVLEGDAALLDLCGGAGPLFSAVRRARDVVRARVCNRADTGEPLVLLAPFSPEHVLYGRVRALDPMRAEGTGVLSGTGSWTAGLSRTQVPEAGSGGGGRRGGGSGIDGTDGVDGEADSAPLRVEDVGPAMQFLVSVVHPRSGPLASACMAYVLASWLLRHGRAHRVTSGECRSLAHACGAMCERALLACGEPVGVLAAQAISAPVTQLMLNAFYVTGGGEMTQQGIPRLKELCSASRMKTPTMTMALRRDPRPRQAGALISVRLDAITRKAYVTRDPVMQAPPHTLKKRDRRVMRDFASVFGSEWELAAQLRSSAAGGGAAAAAGAGGSPGGGLPGAGGAAPTDAVPVPSDWVLRMELDYAECRRHGITPAMVARAVQLCRGNLERATLVYSDACSGAEDRDTGRFQPFWIVRVRPWGVEGSECLTRNWGENFKDSLVRDLCIGGVGRIRNVTRTTAKFWVAPGQERAGEALLPSGGMELRERPCMVTKGSCLMGVARFSWVDWYNTVCNDVTETLDVLGIWPARRLFIQQLKLVLFSQGGYVDDRHLHLLADAMFCRGTMMTVNQTGIVTAPSDALHRCTFEKQLEVLVNAFTVKQTDVLSSATSAVITGQRAPVGTGAVGIVVPYEPGMKKPLHATSRFGHLMPKSDFERFRLLRERRGEMEARKAGRRAAAHGDRGGDRGGDGSADYGGGGAEERKGRSDVDMDDTPDGNGDGGEASGFGDDGEAAGFDGDDGEASSFDGHASDVTEEASFDGADDEERGLTRKVMRTCGAHPLARPTRHRLRPWGPALAPVLPDDRVPDLPPEFAPLPVEDAGAFKADAGAGEDSTAPPVFRPPSP